MIAATPDAGVIHASDPVPLSPPVLPTERCYGLGELIFAYRIYMGLGQRDMARRLDFNLRDYQRIEKGRNRCPVGFLSKVMELVDTFDSVADQIVELARTTEGGINIQIQTDDRWAWERNVAGRAAIIAACANDTPRITLTVMGQEEQR